MSGKKLLKGVPWHFVLLRGRKKVGHGKVGKWSEIRRVTVSR